MIRGWSKIPGHKMTDVCSNGVLEQNSSITVYVHAFLNRKELGIRVMLML
jgi:hypothetical protein